LSKPKPSEDGKCWVDGGLSCSEDVGAEQDAARWLLVEPKRV